MKSKKVKFNKSSLMLVIDWCVFSGVWDRPPWKGYRIRAWGDAVCMYVCTRAPCLYLGNRGLALKSTALRYAFGMKNLQLRKGQTWASWVLWVSRPVVSELVSEVCCSSQVGDGPNRVKCFPLEPGTSWVPGGSTEILRGTKKYVPLLIKCSFLSLLQLTASNSIPQEILGME